MNDKKIETRDIKVILLGESGVGKTCIINRYINNEFSQEIESTLGSSFQTKEIQKGDINYKLNIWDTTGQEKYHSITNLFIKGSQIVILVYSIDSENSFKGLEYWYSSLKDNLQGEDYILAVIGSKCDLINNEIVSEEEAEKFALEKNAIFKLVSSKQFPEGINELFNTLLDELIKKLFIMPNSSATIDIKKNKKKKKKKFC